MSVNQDEFKQILKGKGLKVTTQRIAVLKVLSAFDDKHLTAEEIYELVRVDYPEIGLATVYRTIQLLLELKLIDSIQLGDGYVRYEYGHSDGGQNKHHHHHLVCLTCGKVVSFEDDLLERLEEKIEEKTSFRVIDHDVKLYGYCKDCL